MERQPLSYLPIANIKVGIEHLEEYTGRFGSTMLQRDNLVTTYNHRFGVDWFHAFQSFQSLQPFHVNATFNSGWRFDPAAPGQYGSPGIIYGAAIHRQEMIPLNMEMRSVIKENRNPPKRNTGKIGTISKSMHRKVVINLCQRLQTLLIKNLCQISSRPIDSSGNPDISSGSLQHLGSDSAIGLHVHVDQTCMDTERRKLEKLDARTKFIKLIFFETFLIVLCCCLVVVQLL